MPVTAQALTTNTDGYIITLPYVRSTATYTTLLTLSKSTPTAEAVTSSDHHHGLSSASIAGAVIGSVIGVAVLLLLLYFCCFRDYDTYEDSPSNSTTSDGGGRHEMKKSTTKTFPGATMVKNKGGGKVGLADDSGNAVAWVRKPRPKHKAPLNQPRSSTRSRGPGRRHPIEAVEGLDYPGN